MRTSERLKVVRDEQVSALGRRDREYRAEICVEMRRGEQVVTPVRSTAQHRKGLEKPKHVEEGK